MNNKRFRQLRERIAKTSEEDLIAWLRRMNSVYGNVGIHHGGCYFLAQVIYGRATLRVFKMSMFSDWVSRAIDIAQKTLDSTVRCNEIEFQRILGDAFLEAGEKELELSYDHDAVLQQNQVFLKAPGTFR